MAYLAPSEFATKVVDAGESKLHMANRDVLIRATMAGAIPVSYTHLRAHET